MATQTQPLVSIITPVYNGAEFLRECIESVLAQTYANWDYTILNTAARMHARYRRRIRGERPAHSCGE